MTQAAQCNTCKWEMRGQCYEAPPVPSLAPVNTLQGAALQVIAMRAPVKDTDFCSRYQARLTLK